MNTSLLFVSGLVAALALGSCNNDKSTGNQEPDQPRAESPASYPLDVCVVSGKKLGSMGDPHVITHDGTEVRFCCKACVPKFNEDPDKFIGMLKSGKPGTGNPEQGEQ